MLSLCVSVLVRGNTHSILESKQHHLELADGGAVKVQLQLELRQRAGDDLPVRHAHEISQADHQGGDVLRLQLHLLGALAGEGEGGEGHTVRRSRWASERWLMDAPQRTCMNASVRLATTLSRSSVRI